jgi:hypothetical protein
VAAIALVHGLCRAPLTRLFLGAGENSDDAVPFRVHMEVDHPVDDLLVIGETGQRSYVQAKADRKPRRALLDALKQWGDAVVNDGEPNDTLVLCTAYSTPSLDHLSSALTRLRDPYAQALSTLEQAAVEDFTKAILELHPDANVTGVRDDIVRRCVIWHDDFASSESSAVRAAHTMLGSLFGGYDKGEAAFALLRAKVSDRAVLRSGLDVDQVGALLSKAGFTPVRAMSPASRSTLTRYEDAVRDRARELTIPGLSLDIPPLPVPGLLDNLRVRYREPVDKEHAWGLHEVVPLAAAVRRLPRVLLLGGPGVGKTTALVHLAAAATRQLSAPMPVIVQLGKLADQLKHMREVEIADHVLVEAMDVPTLDPSAANLVRQEALERIRAGRALVMLDALDETGIRRSDFARALKSWLDTAHDDLRVIVSSRDAAYSSAALLGLTEAELGPPFDLTETMLRVIRHAADWPGRPDRDEDAETWLAKREAWLNVAVGEHWEMLDIPLHAMHMAAVAVATRFDDLPPNNALALRAVVELMWLRWEAGIRRQGYDPLPGLPDRDSSADAFNSTFSLVTSQLEGGGQDVETLVAAIAEHLEAEYGSRRGLARTSARQLLTMWDDVGLLVARGPDAIVTPRTRLLIELGRAIRISAMTEEGKEVAVRELIDDIGQREVLLFVIAFDEKVRDLVARLAVDEQDVPAALVLAAAYRRHPSGHEDSLLGVLETLVGAVVDDTCPQLLSVALMLAHLPVPEDLRDEVLWTARLDLPPVWGAIVEAIAAWDWAPVQANPGQLQLDLPDMPKLPPEMDPKDIQWRVSAFSRVLALTDRPESGVELSDLEWSIEPGYALLKAAETMAQLDPGVAAAARSSPLVMNPHTALHIDMLAADLAGVPYGSAAAQPSTGPLAVQRQDMAALASIISTIAESSSSAPGQGDWSLDLTVQVMRVADLHRRRPGVIADIVSQARDTLISLLQDVAAFLGFTPQALAGSAASFAEVLPKDGADETAVAHQWGAILYGDERESDTLHMPYEFGATEDDGEQRRQALDHLISIALSDDPIALYVAVYVLPRLSDVDRALVFDALRARLVAIDSREFAPALGPMSILACDLDPDVVAELRESRSPSIRWGVLDSVTHRVVCEGATELRDLLDSLARDPDLTVRLAMADHVHRQHHIALNNIGDSILTELDEQSAYWSCIRCGATDQPAESSTCRNCGEETKPLLTRSD